MSLKAYYFLGINPEPWEVGSPGIKRTNGGKLVPYIGPSPTLLSYQEAIRDELRGQQKGEPPISGPVQIKIYFWRRLDEYTGASGRKSSMHVADATNMQKALEDALQGIVIVNDRTVRNISSEVVEQGGDVKPGILIYIQSPPSSYYSQEIPDRIQLEMHQVRTSADNIDLDNILD